MNSSEQVVDILLKELTDRAGKVGFANSNNQEGDNEISLVLGLEGCRLLDQYAVLSERDYCDRYGVILQL